MAAGRVVGWGDGQKVNLRDSCNEDLPSKRITTILEHRLCGTYQSQCESLFCSSVNDGVCVGRWALRAVRNCRGRAYAKITERRQLFLGYR